MTFRSVNFNRLRGSTTVFTGPVIEVDATMERLIEKAQVLIEALPYIRSFSGKTFVIKYGGKAMTEVSLKERFAEDVVLMKYVGIHPVIVHGGGPQINGMMKRLGKEPRFVKGVRVTDSETMEIVEMVLGGVINKEIVTLINRHGGRAVGLTGRDGHLFTARPWRGGARKESENPAIPVRTQGMGASKPLTRNSVKGVRAPTSKGHDMGMVGRVDSVDPQILEDLQRSRSIPVIAPIGVGEKGESYNINADLVAGAIASALHAEKLLILTDVKGILDEKGRLLPTLSRKEVGRLIKRGVIHEGMLPKVEACLTALEGGVQKAHIIDGRVTHALLLEIFTDRGVGTEVVE
jgi:acetylglutamate kinase